MSYKNNGHEVTPLAPNLAPASLQFLILCIRQDDATHFSHGIAPVFIVLLPVANDIDAGVDSREKGSAVGLVLTGDIEGSAMIGRGPDHRKACRIVYPLSGGQ